jgi:hypothetical protein
MKWFSVLESNHSLSIVYHNLHQAVTQAVTMDVVCNKGRSAANPSSTADLHPASINRLTRIEARHYGSKRTL